MICSAFNLLNDIDLEKTESRIAAFSQKNAALIKANREKQVLETLSQTERDELERRAREERRRMIEENDRVEEEEEARIKAEVVQALASWLSPCCSDVVADMTQARGAQQTARDIQERGERDKAARAESLAKAIPRSLVDRFNKNGPSSPAEIHSPGSPNYEGPYVPFAYSDPDAAMWTRWYTLLDDYVDGRKGVLDAKKDKDGRYRGGGFDVKAFWEMEIRAATEGLGVEPIKV